MSGFEIFGAVVAAGEVLTKSKSCYNQTRRLQRAPQEVQELLGELANSQIVFAEAKNQLADQDDDLGRGKKEQAPEWVAAVAKLGDRADAKILEIDELVKRNAVFKANKLRVRRIKWLIGTERVKELKADLLAIRGEYEVVLGIVNM